MFENRVLRSIFGPKEDKVTGYRRKFHNEEVHNFYPLPDIIRRIKSRRVRQATYVACMREMRSSHKVLVGKLKDEDH
jgi:hypothetical protein